ncbi:MAG: hypothetical protein ACK53L_04300, partial [Pirellulaceae bacterium]
MLVDPVTAANAYREATLALQSGTVTDAGLLSSYRFAIEAYQQAPVVGSFKVFFNLPAFVIVALITWLAYTGISQSKKSANAMVIFKVLVILFVIGAGAFY